MAEPIFEPRILIKGKALTITFASQFRHCLAFSFSFS
jgi:hypothetical protein